MGQFLVFPYPEPEEAGLAPSWAAGVAGDGKDEKTAPTEAVGCIFAGRAGKIEIPGHAVVDEGMLACLLVGLRRRMRVSAA